MPLTGHKVLIVEDEYLIADDLAALLRDAGAEVIGPAASLPIAMRIIQHADAIDAAVLDINLRGIEVFPLARELQRRGVPILFMTGYDENNIPEEFASVRRCEKPTGATRVVGELSGMLGPVPAAA
jgi:CheY-like chemotaxis protein